MEGILLSVAAVIVTFNSEAVIESCLRALLEKAPQVAAIVIDNASSDATVERARTLPHVRVIANSQNRGFAGAVNQGALSSEADHLLLLNPDVTLVTGMNLLVEASEKYGLSAGQLVNREGHPQKGFSIRRFPTAMTLMFETLGLNWLWPSNPVNKRYRYLDRDLDTPGSVEQPAGAFLMVRKDVWRHLHGLDESFHPIWFEDVDFCNRAVRSGYRIEFVPQVQATHTGGHSIGSLESGCRTLYWCVSLLKYAAKYFSVWENRGVRLTLILGTLPRLGLRMIRERSFIPATTWVEVVRLAVRRRGKPAAIRVSP